MPTIYWYGSCPLLRNLKIEELWELNQDQKGLQNPQENQTGVNETIKKRQVTHLPSNFIITKRGTKNMPLDKISSGIFFLQTEIGSLYLFLHENGLL